MKHVSQVLNQMHEELSKARDNEVSMASECGAQYITDHNDRDAYRRLDREVNTLARAWDKMIAKLEKWEQEALKIENQPENFYGD